MCYEYLVGGLDVAWEPQDEQTQLNKFGATGWELVSVLMRANGNGQAVIYYYFRRPLAGAAKEKHPSETAEPDARKTQ